MILLQLETPSAKAFTPKSLILLLLRNSLKNLPKKQYFT